MPSVDRDQITGPFTLRSQAMVGATRMVTIAKSINVNYHHRRANAEMEPEEGTAFLSPFLLLHLWTAISELITRLRASESLRSVPK